MQSKLSSLLEACAGTAIGFLVSLLAQQFVVAPVWGLKTSVADNIGIVLFFTVLSVVRSYIVRRLFNQRSARNRVC